MTNMKLLKITLNLLIITLITCMPQNARAQSEISLENPFIKCWQINSINGGEYKSASDNENNIYLFSNNGSIQAFDLELKKEFWNFDIGGKFQVTPQIFDNKIYTVTSNFEKNTKIRVLNKSNGIVEWEAEVPITLVSNIFINEQNIILTNSENFIIALDRNLKRVNWTTQVSEKSTVEPTIFNDKIIITLSQKY